MRPPRTHVRRPKPSRAGRGIHVRPCDSTPNSNPSPPQDAHSPSTFYMPDASAPDDPRQTHDAGPRRTTETHDTPLSSAAQLRAPPRLPHLTFSSPDEKWRKPPARTASRSTEDRVSISAPPLPAVNLKGHPTPQSRLGKPRSREQEPRWLVCKNSLMWYNVACAEEIRNKSMPLKLEAPRGPVCGFSLGPVVFFVESPHRALSGTPDAGVPHYDLRCAHNLRMHLARRAVGAPWSLTPGTRAGGPGRCPPVSGSSGACSGCVRTAAEAPPYRGAV